VEPLDKLNLAQEHVLGALADHRKDRIFIHISHLADKFAGESAETYNALMIFNF
jgi:hypothetical protein